MKTRTGLLLATAALAASSPTGAAQPPPSPVFAAAVDLVRLDVVVLDKEGKPFTGLTRDDFVVEEDGKPQALQSFEPVVVRTGRPASADEPPRLTSARLRAPAEGRCVLFFVDDVHVSPASMVAVRRAIRRFLETDVREGDWVTVFAPEEQLWWTARGAWEYRQLAVAADRLVGQGEGDSYRDWAIVRDAEYGQMGTGGESRAVTGAGAGSSGGPGQFAVVGDPNAPVKQDDVIARVRRNTERSLGGLGQALESLVRLRGQKSVILVSEGFLLLPKMPGYREAMDVARRANVAVHFLDPRGVQADQGGTALYLTLSDTTAIAEATGGTTFSGNDAERGLRRVADRGDAYYLLGYEPSKPGPGERKVKVHVRREGLEVKARTVYYVPEPEKPRAKKAAPPPPPSLAAMRSLADSTELPLRVTMLYFEPGKKGEVATMLAAEVLPGPGRTGERLFKLVSEARARDGGPPVRDQFEGTPSVRPAEPIVLSRQWSLPSGVWQVRLVVEDTTTGRIGTVVHTFEVPDAKAFRVSTPILTAELDDPNGKRRPKVALARTFRTGSLVYCQYTVYNAPPAGRHDWAPHVFGSWTLRRGEEVVREAPASLIQPANDGRVTRTLGLSLEGAPPGEYALEIRVRDETTGREAARVESFTVAP